jgi:putative hydrolase of the HAD superfamily
MSPYTTLFLDLDETLYPRGSGLWEAIAERIHDFMTVSMGIPREEAVILRQGYFLRFGTTLNGLMANYDIDPFEYLLYVHDIPLSEHISPNPKLRMMLTRLDQRRVIFTNGSFEYSVRVLEQLEIIDQIDQVVDIVALDFRNKPRPEAYHAALQLTGNPDPPHCIFADDRTTNLLPAAAMGMTTVLVGDGHRDPSVDIQMDSIVELIQHIPSLIDAPYSERP